jgi:hypothetical protein
VKVDTARAERLFATLRKAGMSQVPEGFSVALLHQEIPPATLAGIDGFLRVFDRVTTRRAWQQAVTSSAPEIARRPGREVCFFSAWDFHLPPDHPERWQLIEFNDNGSGFLFAAHINHAFYEVFRLAHRAGVEPPAPFSDFAGLVGGLVNREARGFFGARAAGLLVVVDDACSLEQGRFRDELVLLRDLLRRRGWPAEIAPPEALHWNGTRLALGDREVCFVVNRSTDFFWQAAATASLRSAWSAGRVYVAPNPFTYATRSDKCLLELLSRPDWDAELGVRPEERALLGAHVPETRRLTDESVEEIASRKSEFVLKPAHGFAGRGVLPSTQVGRSRLRRLLRRGDAYVAQRRVPKPALDGAEAPRLWTDLRAWAYRGERFMLSGRASCRPDGIALDAPGGWLATYAGAGPRRRLGSGTV